MNVSMPINIPAPVSMPVSMPVPINEGVSVSISLLVIMYNGSITWYGCDMQCNMDVICMQHSCFLSFALQVPMSMPMPAPMPVPMPVRHGGNAGGDDGDDMDIFADLGELFEGDDEPVRIKIIKRFAGETEYLETKDVLIVPNDAPNIVKRLATNDSTVVSNVFIVFVCPYFALK